MLFQFLEAVLILASQPSATSEPILPTSPSAVTSPSLTDPPPPLIRTLVTTLGPPHHPGQSPHLRTKALWPHKVTIHGSHGLRPGVSGGWDSSPHPCTRPARNKAAGETCVNLSIWPDFQPVLWRTGDSDRWAAGRRLLTDGLCRPGHPFAGPGGG